MVDSYNENGRHIQLRHGARNVRKRRVICNVGFTFHTRQFFSSLFPLHHFGLRTLHHPQIEKTPPPTIFSRHHRQFFSLIIGPAAESRFLLFSLHFNWFADRRRDRCGTPTTRRTSGGRERRQSSNVSGSRFATSPIPRTVCKPTWTE